MTSQSIWKSHKNNHSDNGLSDQDTKMDQIQIEFHPHQLQKSP